VRVHEGSLDATGMRFGIVVSRFNDIVSTPLLEGAVEALELHGVSADDIVIAWVPGAFETPIAARELAAHGGVDAVVCLGAVIRGDTAHFDYVAGPMASSLAGVALATGVHAGDGSSTSDEGSLA